MNQNRPTLGDINAEIDRIREIVADTLTMSEYLNDYMPVDRYTHGVVIKTTDELIAELDDITKTDVNRVMVALGYKPGRNDSGSFGWMLRRIDI